MGVPLRLCSERVGDTWVDGGPVCRSHRRPGPIGLEDLEKMDRHALDPFKVMFDREHIYSLAREAARKRDIDLQIIGDDYSRSAEISIESESYLKQLIELGSGGKQTVSDKAKKIQFFIIRGGAEGFLPADLAGKDASDVAIPWLMTNGKLAQSRFDNNDLLAVFDPQGKLIRAALLQRPVSIPGAWSSRAANEVYNAWHNKEVSIYRNTNFSVPYVGLVVADGKKGVGWVDMHKEEATNGCIFIVDPDTPAMGTPDLDTFEPKLIHEVLASIGKTADQVKGMIRLGIMRVVDIK
jgi:hypothetical protein